MFKECELCGVFGNCNNEGICNDCLLEEDMMDDEEDEEEEYED